jgi:hypothetical protein
VPARIANCNEARTPNPKGRTLAPKALHRGFDQDVEAPLPRLTRLHDVRPADIEHAIGYANSALTSEQVDNYTCATCRADTQVAAETSARFRALVPRVVLKPPLRIVAPAGEPAQH